MSEAGKQTSKRKKEHLDISLSEDAAFVKKMNGFDKYDFLHSAVSEVEIDKIDMTANFLGRKIAYPFFISCMTGGTIEAGNVNEKLAIAAEELNIPVGIGSQRQALENKEHHNTFEVLKEKAPSVPKLGNIGAAQVVALKDVSAINFLIEQIEAAAFVIHLNPLQELMQEEGEPHFAGLLKKIEQLTNSIDIPVVVKEVGAGIEKSSAEQLLNAGVKGIDVAGAGGTSWSKIELIRRKKELSNKEIFAEWGLPTSYCIKTVKELKADYTFELIASGGITNALDIAKALALGADLTASARKLFITVKDSGEEGVVSLIKDWFETVKKIMFLTGSGNINEFRKNKLIRKEELY